MDIKVIIDTNIVDKDTANNLQVLFTKDTQITEFVNGGIKITGDNLIQTDTINRVTLGELSIKMQSLLSQQTQIAQDIIDTQSLIDQATPKVDEAILTILSNGGIDNR